MKAQTYTIISGRTQLPIQSSTDKAGLDALCARYNDDEMLQPDRATGPWKTLYYTEKVKLRISEDEFKALCNHPEIRANRGGARVDGARLVLVQGERPSAAATKCDTAQSNISALVNLMAKVYYGITLSK